MKHLKSVTVLSDKRSHCGECPLGALNGMGDIIVEDRKMNSGLQLKVQTLTILVLSGLGSRQEIAAQKSRLY